MALDAETLYRLLPLRPTLSRSRREELLNRAHRILLRNSYLDTVSIRTRKGSRRVEYHPGPVHTGMRGRLRMMAPVEPSPMLPQKILGRTRLDFQRMLKAHG